MSVEYQVVHKYSDSMKSAISQLETSVRSLCSKGWEPLGGISLCKINDIYDYVASQAMIRKPR